MGNWGLLSIGGYRFVAFCKLGGLMRNKLCILMEGKSEGFVLSEKMIDGL